MQRPTIAVVLAVVAGLLIAVTVVSVEGCRSENPEELPVTRVIEQQAEKGSLRFSVQAQGHFRGGYGNHMREIFILTDNATGKQYLTVTGAGVTELWTESDGDTTETIEE